MGVLIGGYGIEIVTVLPSAALSKYLSPYCRQVHLSHWSRSKLRKLSQITRSAPALIFGPLGGRRKMVDRDTLLSSHRSSIMRFQKLLKTHLTEEDHDYIKERVSACRAAVKALIGSETIRK